MKNNLIIKFNYIQNKLKILNINKLFKECYNLTINKDIIWIILNKSFINLKINNNLNKNLILIIKIILNQEKEHLELLKNVKVKLILIIMQLNKLNLILILVKYKLYNKLKYSSCN